MHWLRRGTPESDAEARRLFERAIEISPTFARSYSGLSLSFFNDWSCSAWQRWDETERQAYRHALEAIRLDPHDHVTHYILGRILLYRREFDRGIAHLRKAVALNPNDADVLVNACLGHAYYGEPERGLELEREALAIHPFHPEWYLAYFAASRFVARRAREARERFERVVDVTVDARAFMAAASADLGELSAAREQAQAFLDRFAERIAFGKPFAREDPVRWILRVNPMRRDEDRAYLLDGLARAGLAVPPEHRP
jgi:tetratricopeptide (TPR) repeat protein